MRISKFVLIAATIGLVDWQSQAQMMSSAQEQQARELLRQRISEERSKVAEEPEAEPPRRQRSSPLGWARDAMRNAITREREKVPAAEPAPGLEPSAMPAREEPAFTGQVTPTPPAQVSPAPASMPSSSGPKTKQQRLMELLNQYMADQVSPKEYHEQRAKIVAEP